MVTVHTKPAKGSGDEFLGQFSLNLKDISLEEEVSKKWWQLDGKLGVKDESLGQILVKYQFYATDLGKMHKLSEQVDLAKIYEDFKDFFFKLDPGHIALLFDHNKFVPSPEEIQALTSIIIDNSEIKTTSFLKFVISGEVKSCLSTATLFRRNSLASKMVTSCMIKFGKEYLIKHISSIVSKVIKENECCEVDPGKFEGDVEKNMKKILDIAEEILNAILGSLDDLPYEVRETASILNKEVHEKYNDKNVERLAIGGCVWLRFICPAITNPTEYLCTGMTVQKDAQRTLILVSKVLQNLSNSVTFEKKEPFMSPANGFLKEWQQKVNDHLYKLIDLEDLKTTTTLDHQKRTVSLKDAVKMSKEDLKMYWSFYIIHQYFDKNILTITEGIDKTPPEFSLPIEDVKAFHQTCSSMTEVLKVIGKPHQIQLIPEKNKEKEKEKELQEKKERKLSLLAKKKE